MPAAWRPRVVFKLPVKELEPVLVETIVPLVVMLPPMEAYPPTSKLVETLAPFTNVQRPVIDWAIEREAGPFVQSRDMEESFVVGL